MPFLMRLAVAEPFETWPSMEQAAAQRFEPKPLREYHDLVMVLAEELRLQRPDGPADAPLIIEEKTSRSDFLHIQVIWDRWLGIPGEDRGHVIMDAYQQVRGTETVLKISSVLGFTSAEAQKLGVEHNVLSAA